MSKRRRRVPSPYAAALCLLLAGAVSTAAAQPAPADSLTWSTDAVEPARFVAAHGREALIMGYPETGLEVWAYPLQILSGYRVAFLPENSTRTLSGESLLRRVEYRPDGVTRVYVGPDFVVRESLFVPLHAPGAILRYRVEGRGQPFIRISFAPSLNLMWPGALGGQGIQWRETLHGYELNEPLDGYTAVVASPQVARHDPVINSTLPQGLGYAMDLAPVADDAGVRQAAVYVGLDTPHAANATVPALEHDEAALRDEVAAHAREVLDRSLRITTPDALLNRSLAWAELALDQAWVCNPQLGCGEVAGYGPSRPGRRPQYEWFFAGDGLEAVDGLLAAAEYPQARDELAFILRYQNQANGMIWHEMSQSAGLIDWQRYPYMFVHVDITFQFLATLAKYVATTGDTAFLQAHWAGVQRAYAYCTSLLDPETGLPQIPADKEGADEQDRLRDDTGLSAEWIAAAEGYASLATAMGNMPAAEQARKAAAQARQRIAATDWDAARGFWIAGHTIHGNAVYDERPDPGGVLGDHVLAPAQTDSVLTKIASAAFETDWGTRSMSSGSPEFDPDSYAKGSVSALATAGIAQAFWQAHRPLTAWQIWSGLIPWNTLDSMGHMHEVLAGDLYHPQVESVPEQTWSSAGFLAAAVHGLLGIGVDADARTLTFSPRLPHAWQQVSVENVRVGASTLRLALQQSDGVVQLEADNRGDAATIDFMTELPLGATLQSATVNGVAAHAVVSRYPQEQTATLRLVVAARGTTRCTLTYTGGVAIDVPGAAPAIGDPSRMLRITTLAYTGHTLALTADIFPHGQQSLTLYTPWKPVHTVGATLAPAGPGVLTLTFTPRSGAANGAGTVNAEVEFAER